MTDGGRMKAVPVEVEVAEDGVLYAEAKRCNVPPGRYEGFVVLAPAAQVAEPRSASESDASLPLEPLDDYIARMRTAHVERALALCDGNRSQAARMLRVDPRTMFRHVARKESR